MPAPGPTVVQRQLGRRLKALRQTAGVSADQVVANKRLGISRAKLYKLEAGAHSVKPQDVNVLCRHYGATERETDALIDLAVATREPSWWHGYGNDIVPEWFRLFLDLEPAASSIRTYQPELIPGILQTKSYAEAINAASNLPNAPIAEWVAVRIERQAILERADPPKLHAIIGEAALLRNVGGNDTMKAQTEKLRHYARRPNVSIGVVPLSSGPYEAMGKAFVLLDFQDPQTDPSVAYLENVVSTTYVYDTEQMRRFEAVFGQLQTLAIPIEDYRHES